MRLDDHCMTMTIERIRPLRRGRRDGFSATERAGGLAVAVAVGAFGTYGHLAGEPSTVGYVTVVAALGAGVVALRRQVLPNWLVVGLSMLAVGHLCGGLIRIGDEVLYNTDPGWELLQYDHVFHASASALGVAVLWTLASSKIDGRHLGLMLCALGALGLGALNELVEYLATLAHRGSHVGGYTNTGWDFVANTFGVVVGAAVLATRSSR